MWSIKALSGPMAGQTFALREGENTIGRGTDCDIVLAVQGVSKQHARIRMQNGAMTIYDLGSRNGTFVNGHMVKQKTITSNDRFAVYSVIFAIVPTQSARPSQSSSPAYSGGAAMKLEIEQPIQGFNQAPGRGGIGQPQPMGLAGGFEQQEAWEPPKTFFDTLRHYVENVAMPGVYHLVEIFEYRFVLASFIGAFALVVTVLATIPMVALTKSSIEAESRRRALTIARNLAVINQPALQQGMESTITTQPAEREEGVDAALIVSSSDGSVIAPQKRAGSYAADLKFVHTARKFNREMVQKIDSSLIGASVPIQSFNPEVGQYNVTAHAVVLYSMDSISVDSGRVVSLFTQILLIAGLFGGLVFFFIYRLTLKPASELNAKLDAALKEGRDQVEIPYQIPEFQALALNISGALARAKNGGGSAPVAQDKTGEATNLVQIIGHPAMAVDPNGSIIYVNQYFENLVGARLASLQMQPLDVISDQAFKLSLQELLDKCRQSPGLIASHSLEFNGVGYEIDAQTVSDSTGPSYFMVSLKQAGGF